MKRWSDQERWSTALCLSRKARAPLWGVKQPLASLMVLGLASACDFQDDVAAQPSSNEAKEASLGDAPDLAREQARDEPPLSDEERKYVDVQRRLAELREWRKDKVTGGVPFEKAQEVFQLKASDAVDESGLAPETYEELSRKVQMDATFGQRIQKEIDSDS